MYRQFGSNGQVSLETEADYFELLGYLAKGDGTTKVVWENNQQQGAWAAEGRIQFYEEQPGALHANLHQTAGTGNVIFRVNCNEYVRHLIDDYGFSLDGPPDTAAIRSLIPPANLNDFDRGLAL